MAKEKEKTIATEVATVDNIREQLDSASVARRELSEKVLAKIKEEKDERIQREMKSRYEKANYMIDQQLENLRRERDLAKLTKAKLVLINRAAGLMMGFTVKERDLKDIEDVPDTLFEKISFDKKSATIVITFSEKEKKSFKVGEEVPPVVDYVDYDGMLTKINDHVREKSNEIDRVHKNYLKKLDAKYDEYWESSWRYC